VTNDEMQELARVGAQARLQAIDEERSAILRAFPALGSRPTPVSNNRPSATARRTGKGMSPTQRKAVGERMKAYWTKRRAEKAGEAGPKAQTAAEAPVTPTPASKRKGMSPGRQAQAEKMRAYWAARRAATQGASGKRAGRKTGRKK
jgi:hypothetical protein